MLGDEFLASLGTKTMILGIVALGMKSLVRETVRNSAWWVFVKRLHFFGQLTLR